MFQNELCILCLNRVVCPVSSFTQIHTADIKTGYNNTTIALSLLRLPASLFES